ncbi:MAG: PIN domain-containing protein [Desulfobacterales bacterium]
MKLPAKVYLIDTNVILRYLMADHEKFSPKAKAFMVEVSQGKTRAEIPAVVITECVYVMEKFYKIPRLEIADTFGRILNFSGIVNPDKSEILEALIKYEESNADIVDCLLAASSAPDRVVVSFDKDFATLKATAESL